MEGVIQVTDTNFQREVLNSKIPVLVDFWAEWCAPCHMVAPAVEEIAKEYEGKLKVCKLDVDEAGDLAGTFGVMSIPTLILFKAGQKVEQVVGAVLKGQLQELVNKNL